MNVSQKGLSLSCWFTSGYTLTFPISFHNQIPATSHPKAALNGAQMQQSKQSLAGREDLL